MAGGVPGRNSPSRANPNWCWLGYHLLILLTSSAISSSIVAAMATVTAGAVLLGRTRSGSRSQLSGRCSIGRASGLRKVNGKWIFDRPTSSGRERIKGFRSAAFVKRRQERASGEGSFGKDTQTLLDSFMREEEQKGDLKVFDTSKHSILIEREEECDDHASPGLSTGLFSKLWRERQEEGAKAAAVALDQHHILGQNDVLSSSPDTGGFAAIQSYVQDLVAKVPSRIRGLVMLNLLVLLCATNWVIVKETGASFDPYWFASLRFGVASLLFAPVLLESARDEKVLRGGVEVGLLTALGYLFQSQGLLTTDASRASFLSTFTVLVVPFLAGLTGRGVRPLTWASALAALVGVSMLEQSGSPPCLGDLWSALSAIAFGVQMFRTEHWSRVLGQERAIPLMSVVLTTTAFASILAAGWTHADEIISIVQGITQSGSFAIPGEASIPWSEVIYTGILTTDVVLLMEVVALQDVSSTEAAIIYTMEPVLGAAFAFVLLGERWGPMGWVGASLIVTSCLCMQIWGQQEDSV